MYVDLPNSECMDGDDRQADLKDMHVRSYAYIHTLPLRTLPTIPAEHVDLERKLCVQNYPR